jgi:hypothetical protein
MPTVLRWNGYRFYFFSNEGDVPPHIHVDKAGCSAKLWLRPVEIAKNIGYSAREIAEIVRKVEAEAGVFEGKWREFFGH